MCVMYSPPNRVPSLLEWEVSLSFCRTRRAISASFACWIHRPKYPTRSVRQMLTHSSGGTTASKWYIHDNAYNPLTVLSASISVLSIMNYS